MSFRLNITNCRLMYKQGCSYKNCYINIVHKNLQDFFILQFTIGNINNLVKFARSFKLRILFPDIEL